MEATAPDGLKLKVLLVMPWDEEVGGVQSVVNNLANHLERRGHGVVMLHPGESNRPIARRTLHGFTGYELNLRSPSVPGRRIKSLIAFLVYLVPTLYRLSRIVRAHRIRIVNLHYPVEAFVYFGMLRWLLPVKMVVSVHGADLFPGGRAPKGRRWSLRFLLSRADAIVAPSAAFLRDCSALFPAAFRRGIRIHNGVDTEELSSSGASAPGPPLDEPFVLCIAEHNSKKALDVLLRAFASVSDTDRRLKLRLVGDGPLRQELEEQARRLSLADRVMFMGRRTRSEVFSLLNACKLAVLPSRSEPFGMVVVEALLCRRPVVATAVGGIPEIIEDRRSGLLVAADDDRALAAAIREVLENEELARSLGENGYARARAFFTSERMGSDYERLFLEISASPQ